MDIKWYGKGCFRIKERNNILFTDPTPLRANAARAKLKADIVTFSSGEVDTKALESFSSEPYVITRIGEYEVGGIFVTSIGPNGKESNNRVMLYHFEDMTVCYLGELDHVLGQSEVEALGAVDILLVPAGGAGLISAAQVAEVISLVEPRLIVPGHYEGQPSEALDRFLKEMGSSASSSLDELRVSRSSLPEESQVYLLNPS